MTVVCLSSKQLKYQKLSPMCEQIFSRARTVPTSTKQQIRHSRSMIMRAMFVALLTLSLLAGVAAPASAYDPSVGPPTYWTPHDPSPPGSPPG